MDLRDRKIRNRHLPGYEFAEVWYQTKYTPTPETEPAAVFAGQVADVRAATDRPGWSIAGLVAELVLPEWNVRRCLFALGRLPAGEWHEKRPEGEPRPRTAAGRVRFSKRWQDFERAMKGCRGLTTQQVADRAGATLPAACNVLSQAAKRGLVRRDKKGPKGRSGARFYYLWRLTGG